MAEGSRLETVVVDGEFVHGAPARMDAGRPAGKTAKPIRLPPCVSADDEIAMGGTDTGTL